MPAPGNQTDSDPQPIAVALVEDNQGLRESLVLLLDGTPGFRCAGSLGSAEAALKSLAGLRPDVVLMDIHLPRMSGIECVRALRDKLPKSKILMLTIFADGDHIFKALMSGANGYLSKKTPHGELLKAIEDVHHGGAPMSADIAVRVVQYFNKKGATVEPLPRLSPREAEILEHLAKGALYKEIAASLNLAYDTVQWHIRNIYEKLHVRSRSEAVARYRPKDPF